MAGDAERVLATAEDKRHDQILSSSSRWRRHLKYRVCRGPGACATTAVTHSVTIIDKGIGPLPEHTIDQAAPTASAVATIKLADIGAAFFAETPPYQILLDRKLARLFAFEPDPRETENLRQHLGETGQVIPYAVADGATHTFYSCPKTSGMSSLLEPDPINLAFFNGFPLFGAIESTSLMDTRRLDDIEEIPQIDFLKMDIQGAEMMVLKNGRKKLSDCVAVQTEVSFIALYKNQPSFGDIDLELRSQNLIPHCFPAIKKWSISPAIRDNDWRAPFNQLLEADVVYIRDITRPDAMSDLQIRKLATIAHYVYSSFDLVIRCLYELQNRKACDNQAADEYMRTRELPAA